MENSNITVIEPGGSRDLVFEKNVENIDKVFLTTPVAQGRNVNTN